MVISTFSKEIEVEVPPVVEPLLVEDLDSGELRFLILTSVMKAKGVKITFNLFPYLHVPLGTFVA